MMMVMMMLMHGDDDDDGDGDDDDDDATEAGADWCTCAPAICAHMSHCTMSALRIPNPKGQGRQFWQCGLLFVAQLHTCSIVCMWVGSIYCPLTLMVLHKFLVQCNPYDDKQGASPC